MSSTVAHFSTTQVKDIPELESHFKGNFSITLGLPSHSSLFQRALILPLLVFVLDVVCKFWEASELLAVSLIIIS